MSSELSQRTQRIKDLAERRIDERDRDVAEAAAQPVRDPAVYGRDRRLPLRRTR